MGYDIIGYESEGNELVSGEVDDLLSGYDIVGYAPRGRRAAPPRGFARAPRGYPAQHRQVPQHGTMLHEQEPSKDGQLVLPMSSSGTVAAATAATITARPQVKAYRPQRIVIATSIAAFFTLSDIKVGNKSQFVQSGTIPAEAFVQGAFGVAMRMDTVQTAMDFVFLVNNIDAAAHLFLCVIFGRAVD